MRRVLLAIVAGTVLLFVGFIAGMIVESSVSGVQPQSVAAFQEAFQSGELRQYDNMSVTIGFLGKPSVSVKAPIRADSKPDVDDADLYFFGYFNEAGGVHIYTSDGEMHSVLVVYGYDPRVNPQGARYRWLCFDSDKMQAFSGGNVESMSTIEKP